MERHEKVTTASSTAKPPRRKSKRPDALQTKRRDDEKDKAGSSASTGGKGGKKTNGGTTSTSTATVAKTPPAQLPSKVVKPQPQPKPKETTTAENTGPGFVIPKKKQQPPSGPRPGELPLRDLPITHVPQVTSSHRAFKAHNYSTRQLPETDPRSRKEQHQKITGRDQYRPDTTRTNPRGGHGASSGTRGGHSGSSSGREGQGVPGQGKKHYQTVQRRPDDFEWDIQAAQKATSKPLAKGVVKASNAQSEDFSSNKKIEHKENKGPKTPPQEPPKEKEKKRREYVQTSSRHTASSVSSSASSRHRADSRDRERSSRRQQSTWRRHRDSRSPNSRQDTPIPSSTSSRRPSISSSASVHSHSSSRRHRSPSDKSSDRAKTSKPFGKPSADQQPVKTASTILAEQRLLEEEMSASAGFAGKGGLDEWGYTEPDQSGFAAALREANERFSNSAFAAQSTPKLKATGSQNQKASGNQDRSKQQKRSASASSKDKSKFKKPMPLLTARRPPVSAEFKLHDPKPLALVEDHEYFIMDAGPGFATGILKEPNEAAPEAPPFVHITLKDDPKARLRIGFSAKIRKFYRMWDRTGKPAPEQSVRTSAAELCQKRGEKTVFVPSYIVKEYQLIGSKSEHILHDIPSMVMNKPAARRFRDDDHTYTLMFEIANGYILGMKPATNLHIDSIYSVENTNLPAQNAVVLVDGFRVVRGEFSRLAQCAVPKNIFHQDALEDHPATLIIERVYPLTDKRQSLLEKLADLSHVFPEPKNYHNTFDFTRDALMMHVGATINLEMIADRQSEIPVMIMKTRKDHRTHIDKYPIEGRAIDKNVMRNRANRLREGSAIVMRPLAVQKKGEAFKYSREKPFYKGRIEKVGAKDGKVYQLTTYRPSFRPVIDKELHQQERLRKEAAELARTLEKSNVHPSSAEAKKKMKNALDKKKLAENAIALSEDKNQSGRSDAWSEESEEGSSQDKHRKQKDKEDAPGATDALFFSNQGIQTGPSHRYALSADETVNSNQTVLLAYQRWSHNLFGKTLASKICCILSGVKPPHSDATYEEYTENSKLLRRTIEKKATEFAKAARTDEEEDSEDSEESRRQGQFVQLIGDRRQKIKEKLAEQKQSKDFMRAAILNQHSLDEEQKKAVILLLYRPVTKCQAPSGTGKTYLSAHAAIYCLKAFWNEGVVLTSESNQAVQHMVTQVKNVMARFSESPIGDHSIFLVRSNSAEMKSPLTEEQKLSDCLLKSQLEYLMTLDVDDSSEENWTTKRHDAVKKYLEFLENDVYAATNLHTMNSYVIRYNPRLRIVALTKSQAFNLRFELTATTWLVDEAGQVISDDLIVLLSDSRCERILCTGDLFQTGAFVPFGLEGKAFGLHQNSVMENLEGRMQACDEHFRAEVTLRKCYRFQSTLREILSYSCYEEFSESLLEPDEGAYRKEQIALCGFPFPKRHVPILLLHTTSKCENPETGSCSNEDQRKLAGRTQLNLMAFLIAKKLYDKRTMINCFYLDEANLMRRELEAAGSISAEAYTVTGFQGQEREIQMVITSRDTIDTKDNIVPFYLDIKLVTTALTRGAEALVLIGNFSSIADLRYGPMSRFIFECVRRGIPIVDVRYLEFVDKHRDLLMADPKVAPYNEAGELLDDNGKDFRADTWANNIDRHQQRATPRTHYKWLRPLKPGQTDSRKKVIVRPPRDPQDGPSQEYIARARAQNEAIRKIVADEVAFIQAGGTVLDEIDTVAVYRRASESHASMEAALQALSGHQSTTSETIESLTEALTVDTSTPSTSRVVQDVDPDPDVVTALFTEEMNTTEKPDDSVQSDEAMDE